MNATPLSFNQHLMEALKPYCLATADERGVVLIEPFQPSPPLKLVYSSYDEVSRTHKATLSLKQFKEMGDFLRRVLSINTSFMDLYVAATPTSLLVGFTIHPSILHGQTIVPSCHAGLSILSVSGQRVGFMWNVDKSAITWPSWIERPTF